MNRFVIVCESLTGNTATGNGGAIDLQKGSAVLMGGKVTDGAATLGKSVYVGAEGSITVGGTVRCGEIYLTKGKTLTVDNLDPAKASLTVTLEVASDPIATGLTADISGCVTSGKSHSLSEVGLLAKVTTHTAPSPLRWRRPFPA